ncbi:hydrolase [Rhodocollybia butyracea]|uniref:Hydrolase n=1 Tax=Rhodocollybia butyracea TaxID=206335 RepID=A0A9P5U5Z5_9AGAR|nr:hydrolase [Rhodocollybia butyracea]
MGKNNKQSSTPSESFLQLPAHSSTVKIVDTHTHLASTFESYISKYNKTGNAQYKNVFDFVKGMYTGKRVEAIVDVWCEAPVRKLWKEFADSALKEEDRKEKWGGLEYWFVMGVHPHDAKLYNDEVEANILEAMQHPRCVGWGEMGLDYHYDNSPRQIQQDVFARQLKQAVRLKKPLTIHTREADADTERILKEIVPKDHPVMKKPFYCNIPANFHTQIHIHCFTDSPDFGQRLLDHFPNLCIGITGVVTFASNYDTSTLIRRMAAPSASPSASPLRILLETDAPYMVPSNIYPSMYSMPNGNELRGKRLPLSHTAMIPWTSDFVAKLVNEIKKEGTRVNSDWILREARANARRVYGV